jgi:hypothetical protein
MHLITLLPLNGSRPVTVSQSWVCILQSGVGHYYHSVLVVTCVARTALGTAAESSDCMLIAWSSLVPWSQAHQQDTANRVMMESSSGS